MISAFFPLKKLRRNTVCLLFLAILLIGAVAVYHEIVAANAWRSDASMTDSGSWRRDLFNERVRGGHPLEDSAAWRLSYTPQTWKPEYKGQANLHVFEDWCGTSMADLGRNMHYPLYPHSRTTVQKLAVSPQWTNYGLRIFGYLHPYTDGEFVFALSSDDNSEFWLSTDETPLNAQLLAWVGKTGQEWTAPGEFNKYVSQTSKAVRLSARRRYFFEVIHKQDDRGTDHVEVAWQLLDHDVRFMVIDSNHISLYVNESTLLLSNVAHIPQTPASHQFTPVKQDGATADMLREDPRDTLYQVPLINSKFLQAVLPECSYKPSYTIKDFPLLRYQGLQFVHMSYIYPKDFTRLTHMETQSSCFYPESPYYMKMFGFSRYMRLDRPDTHGQGNPANDFGFGRGKSVWEDNEVYQRQKKIGPDRMDNNLFRDYDDDYDDYAQKRRRRILSFALKEATGALKNTSGTKLELPWRQVKNGQLESQRVVEPLQSLPLQGANHSKYLQHNQTDLNPTGQVRKVEQIKPNAKLRRAKKLKLKSVEAAVKLGHKNPAMLADREQLRAKEQTVTASETLSHKLPHIQRSQRINHTRIQTVTGSNNAPPPEKNAAANQQRSETTAKQPIIHKRDDSLVRLKEWDADTRKQLRDKEIEMNTPLQQDVEKIIARGKMGQKRSEKKEEEFQGGPEEEEKFHDGDLRGRRTREGDSDSVWGEEEDFEDEDDEDLTPAPVFDPDVNWSQTFQVSHLDLQAHRSDWIDLRCNISGNLLLQSDDALPIIKAFMAKLNEKHHGRFTLVRVVNVVKRVDGVQGSRYLLELEVKDVHGRLLRLSHYIYTLFHYSRNRNRDFDPLQPQGQLMLCNPVGFRWNPAATVHFIVPVKNQARWVQQLIADMEQLFRITGDANFNLIITDYNSTDMDVRQALQKSSLPSYKYVNLSGNFERSAGLQAGVDLINDDHSIVFLCDLHIHFPPSIIDTVRKHCVEGFMAFAPIVLRLDCGATPSDARGYWEVNGFGLLGIYKSDLIAVGGMNTREFRDRWGGEDWELLDRILQAGLEVERIYLRNFFHHYHSKRGMWNRRTMPRYR